MKFRVSRILGSIQGFIEPKRNLRFRDAKASVRLYRQYSLVHWQDKLLVSFD